MKRTELELIAQRALAIAGAALVLAGLLGLGTFLERAIVGAP